LLREKRRWDILLNRESTNGFWLVEIYLVLKAILVKPGLNLFYGLFDDWQTFSSYSVVPRRAFKRFLIKPGPNLFHGLFDDIA